jgi:RHS repeat-associated protein
MACHFKRKPLNWPQLFEIGLSNTPQKKVLLGAKKPVAIVGSRYYDPDTARFISQDSYLGEEAVPPSLDRYLYAYSNPTVYTDLEGYMSLDKHREATKAALNQAIKNGDVQLPSGFLNKMKFKANLQIGSMLPDVQYKPVSGGIYLYSLKEMLPTEKIQEWVSEKVENVKDRIKGVVKAGLKKASPQAYLTCETAKHWWDDSDIKKPAIEWTSKKVPAVKDLDIVQTHFYGGQWQHGMGEDQEAIQKQIIYDTVKRITSYQSYLANGDIENAARELGIVMHYLQDTWTPSHTARDESGAITYMYDYTKQSPKLHGLADEPESDSTTMQNAIKSSAELLKLIQQYGNDPEAMERVLREKVYRMDYDPDHSNPYAPRATREDAINAVKRYADKVLKPFKTNSQEVQEKITDYFEKKRKLLE